MDLLTGKHRGQIERNGAIMKSVYIILGITMVFFFTVHLSGQQIFKVGGQQLGNSFSWNVKLDDLDGDGDLDASVANVTFKDTPQKSEIWLNYDKTP
jgi:hypothetical protein